METERYYSNGKLLISGEYLVLEGATALAVPLKFGQKLNVIPNQTGFYYWKSYEQGNLWFEATFELKTNEIIETTDREIASIIQGIVIEAEKLAGRKLDHGLSFISEIAFNRNYGWGTSSTLINNIAGFFRIDPFRLLDKTFGGSGYDIACANADSPITFRLSDHEKNIRKLEWEPVFKNNIHFVYLGRKQNSRDQIREFRSIKVHGTDVQKISDISLDISTADTLEEFNELLNEHERIMSRILGRETVKELYFSDFEGQCKSLGAWGGDFILMTSERSPEQIKNYLKNKNLKIVYTFNELVKQ